MLGIKSTSKEYVVKGQKDLAAYAGFLCQEKNKPQKQTRRGGRISELRIISWIGELLYSFLQNTKQR